MANVSENPHYKKIKNLLDLTTSPNYVFEWFMKKLATRNYALFKQDPVELLVNYRALFSMGNKLLKSKYDDGTYAKFIKDASTPNWTYFFVGDTHGSYRDTFLILDFIMKAMQVDQNIKVVFLGDYVDRNSFDLQNLALILSFWMCFPNNVFLLRGNHESLDVCSRYGFSNNLYEAAGSSKKVFQPVWDEVLKLFTNLPLAYYCRVGDKNVFSLHGGIPFDVNNYSPLRLQEIESSLDCYREETFDIDTLSQSILWSDPDPFMLDREGDVAPTPRTGRPRFSEKAFNTFMQINHLDLLVRGHQKFKSGYKLLFNNRLVSLFSASTYDGRRIGESKFLRLTPEMKIDELGEESQNKGKGILWVEEQFLGYALSIYYNV